MAFNINGTTGLTFNNGSAQDVGGIGTGGQTWQDVTLSRSLGTTYTNTTGKPIFVSIWGISSGNALLQGLVDGVQISVSAQGYTNGATVPIQIMVQPGLSYSVQQGSASVSLTKWFELR